MKTKEQKIEEINGQLTMLLNFVTYHEREQYKETSKDKPPTPNDANLVLLGFEEEATPYNSKHFELNDLKVVLLGQDPYIRYELHNDKIIPQAMGLAFSVPKEIKKIPPSLKNIFKTIKFNIFISRYNI